MANRTSDYLKQLKTDYTKICRLRFLNPDGSVAFVVDNNPKNKYSSAFISDGTLTVNLQNGQRRNLSATFDNVDEKFNYDINHMWFGTEVALDEGLILQDGEEYYINQGVFVLSTPTENILPTGKTITFDLVDKWAVLDGTLGGNLENTYEVASGTNIFTPIRQLLSQDRGNGIPIDNVPPVFTDYYNDKTQEVPGSATPVSMVLSPYTLTIDSGTYAEVILGLAAMVNGMVGYSPSGALTIDPSQDDISDLSKPISWRFSQDESELVGLSYSVNNTEVYNDYIVFGEALDENPQPNARAQNHDPSSDTAIEKIGYKTIREDAAGYGTNTQCADYAQWKLKRCAVLTKSVSISCKQILHLQENQIVTVIRSDKKGSPEERHLVQGFTRPLTGNGLMTISATSVYDYPNISVTNWNP